VQRELDDLNASDDVNVLGEQRLQTLRAGSHAASVEATSVIDLLERLDAFAQRARELDDGQLSAQHFETREVRDGYDPHMERHSGKRLRGLGPRAGTIEVPLAANLDALAHRARPAVAALRDDLVILRHQLHAAATRGLEHFVVVAESLTPDNDAHLNSVAAMFVWPFARVQRLFESVVDGATSWSEKFPNGRITRYALSLEGYGLRELLTSSSGYHLAVTQTAAGSTMGIVETTVLEGSGLAPVVAHDRERTLARERRRRGETDEESLEPGLVVTRRLDVVQRHLATGLAAHAFDAVAAALLSARHDGGEA
jgi:hypothetical protein